MITEDDTLIDRDHIIIILLPSINNHGHYLD